MGLTISLSGRFLKPIIVAKGKTKRCLMKYGLKSNTIGTYTKSSWVNENCIIILLDEIYKITSGEQSVLVMDKYDTHTTMKIKNYAKDKNIHIIYVPTGLTYKYQPLDIHINGIIKEKAIQKFSNFKAINPHIKYDHRQCIIDIMDIINSITKRVIIRSFDCIK